MTLGDSNIPKWKQHELPISSLFGKTGKDLPTDLDSFRIAEQTQENPFYIDDELLNKARDDVIELPTKSRIFLRVNTWRQHTPLQPDADQRGQREHPHLERTTKFFSFKCTPGTRDWHEYVRIFRKAFIYREFLLKQDPFYDVILSPLDEPLPPSSFGVLKHLPRDTRYPPDGLRNLFSTHHILVVPPGDGGKKGVYASADLLNDCFGIDPDSPLVVHGMQSLV